MDGLAAKVFDLFTGLDGESAKILAGMIISEGVHYDLGDYDVSKAYMEHCSKRAEVIKRSLIRSYVSKRARGEDVSSLVATANAIAKAESAERRREETKDQPRSAGGRFGHRPQKPGRAFHTQRDVGEGKQTQRVEARRDTFDTMNMLAGEARTSAANLGLGVGGQNDTRAFVPGVRNVQRAGEGARFLQATVGGYTPPPVQLGLHTASFVGGYADEAQRAFGPAADRAKYRYKGVERKLDDSLKDAVTTDRKRSSNLTGRAADEAFITTVTRRTNEPEIRRRQARGTTGGAIQATERGVETPSDTIKYFQDHLPNERMAQLQRFSGHQPPSQGIIIDREGKVGAQMHGVGDDWYLPFNLHNLGNLKGGQYIRTRTHGGLSTEDVYTGLMAGADQMTVVSHNGVYTMQFDPSLRGTRRYSQTAREMTTRYGQLLDAVKNGNVHVNRFEDVDPWRAAEIQASSGNDPVLYRQKIEAERNNPTPSEQIQRNWTGEFIDTLAPSTTTATGESMDPADFEQQVVIPAMVDQAMYNNVIPGVDATRDLIDQEALRAQAEIDLRSSPEMAIDALATQRNRPNLRTQYINYMGRRGMDYRAQLRPLQLDGEGYAYAAAALKEQFPYFIHDTRWTFQRRGPGDKGYVMPRFNRSADVLAGYYDKQITGFSKVPANRIRYQNAAVQPTIETGMVPGVEGLRARDTSTTTPAEGEKKEEDKAKTPQARHASRTKLERRRAADLALVQHYLQSPTISQSFRLEGAVDFSDRVKGTPAGGMRMDKGLFNDPNWPQFRNFGRPLTEFEDMNNDDLHDAVTQMRQANRTHRIFDEDKDILARYNAGGGPLRPQDVDLAEVDPDTEQDFGFGEDYEPGKDRSHYTRLWQGTLNQAVLRDMEAPSLTIDSDRIADVTSEYIGSKQGELRTAIGDDDTDVQRRVQRDITGALRVRQLHRNWIAAGEEGSGGGGTTGGNGSGGGGGGGTGFGLSGRTNILPGGGGAGSAVPAVPTPSSQFGTLVPYHAHRPHTYG